MSATHFSHVWQRSRLSSAGLTVEISAVYFSTVCKGAEVSSMQASVNHGTHDVEVCGKCLSGVCQVFVDLRAIVNTVCGKCLFSMRAIVNATFIHSLSTDFIAQLKCVACVCSICVA